MKKLSDNEYRIIFDWYTKYGKLRTMARRHPEGWEQLLGDNTDCFLAKEIMRLRYKIDQPLSFKEISAKLNVAERVVYQHHKEVLDKAIFCNTGRK